MAKNKFGLGMLAIVFVFSITAIACDNGTTNGNGGNGRTDPALNGTWDGTSSNVVGDTVIFNNGNFETFYHGEPSIIGTFTTIGSTIAITYTYFHTNALYRNWHIVTGFPPRFYSRAALRSVMILDGGFGSITEIDALLDVLFHPIPITFYVRGNTLTIDGDTFTRRT